MSLKMFKEILRSGYVEGFDLCLDINIIDTGLFKSGKKLKDVVSLKSIKYLKNIKYDNLDYIMLCIVKYVYENPLSDTIETIEHQVSDTIETVSDSYFDELMKIYGIKIYGLADWFHAIIKSIKPDVVNFNVIMKNLRKISTYIYIDDNRVIENLGTIIAMINGGFRDLIDKFEWRVDIIEALKYHDKFDKFPSRLEIMVDFMTARFPLIDEPHKIEFIIKHRDIMTGFDSFIDYYMIGILFEENAKWHSRNYDKYIFPLITCGYSLKIPCHVKNSLMIKRIINGIDPKHYRFEGSNIDFLRLIDSPKKEKFILMMIFDKHYTKHRNYLISEYLKIVPETPELLKLFNIDKKPKLGMSEADMKFIFWINSLNK